jgi:hypothetical protein
MSVEGNRNMVEIHNFVASDSESTWKKLQCQNPSRNRGEKIISALAKQWLHSPSARQVISSHSPLQRFTQL